MKKRLKIAGMLFFNAGVLINVALMLFEPGWSIFALDLLKRVSGVSMLIGLVYIGWCIGKKRSPYNFND